MEIKKESKLTTWQLLQNKFPANECVLIEEVSDASGFSRSRSLDFMVINLWESRGLSVTGIERKSNRGDWLKELKQPAKQENHFKYCDYFYLLTDKEGVAKLEEIPETWGWYHTTASTIKTMKAAPKLNPLPIGRSLMCAMIRRAASKEKYIHIDSMEQNIQARAEKIRVDRNFLAERNLSDYKQLKKEIDEFKEASGIDLSFSKWDSYGGKKTGEIVKIILSHEIDDYKKNLIALETRVKNIHSSITTALGGIELPGVQASVATKAR